MPNPGHEPTTSSKAHNQYLKDTGNISIPPNLQLHKIEYQQKPSMYISDNLYHKTEVIKQTSETKSKAINTAQRITTEVEPQNYSEGMQG